jgi:hypothetical protein
VSTGPGGYVLRGDPSRLASQYRFARAAAVVSFVITGWIVVSGVVAGMAVGHLAWVGFAVCAVVFGGLGALMVGAMRRSTPGAAGRLVLAALGPDGVLELADGTVLSLAEVTGIERRVLAPIGRPASPGARLGERLVRNVEGRRPELSRSSLLITFHRGSLAPVTLPIGPVALPGDVDGFLAELAAAAGRRGIDLWSAPNPEP